MPVKSVIYLLLPQMHYFLPLNLKMNTYRLHGVSPSLSEAICGSNDDRECTQLLGSPYAGLNVPVQLESNTLLWCGFKIDGDNIDKTIQNSTNEPTPFLCHSTILIHVW